MPNVYQPWQVFTNEALMILKNKLVFLKGCNRDNEYLFAKPGMKSGNTINVRLPARFVGRSGEAYQPEAYVQTSVPVVVRPLAGVDIDIPSTEWTLNIDDVKKNILNPAMAQLVNNVERDCLQIAYQGVANWVGTLGTAPTAILTPLQAGAYLTNEGAPDDDTRRMLINPTTNVSLVGTAGGMSTFFNPQSKISDQFERGMLAKNTLGWDFYQTQNLWQHTVGTCTGTPLVNGPNQTGSSIVTDGWTANAAILNKGDVISFTSVKAVNPMTRQTYNGSTDSGRRQFVVTADVTADAGGNATIPIFPNLVPAPQQFATVDVVAPDNDPIRVWGTAQAGLAALAGTVSAQNLGYHKDAFTFAGISQEIPKGSTEMAYQATDPETGIQLRFVRQFVATQNLFVNRFDVLYAFATTYGQLGVRMQGA